jgi:hypothetical protein
VTSPVHPAGQLPGRPATPVLIVGGVAAVTAGAMAAVAGQRQSVLLGFVLIAQVGFVMAWAYLLDTPGLVGAIAISAGAAAASDGVLLAAHHVSLTDLATIVAFAFLLALLWQIARPHRTRVTESLASTLCAVVLAVAGGTYLTLRAGLNGEQSAVAGGHATTAALLGVAVVLGVGRLVDAFWARPALSGSGNRGLPGLVLGLAAAAGAGAWYGAEAAIAGDSGPVISRGGSLGTGGALWIALVAAAVAAVIDLGIDAGLVTLDRDRPTGSGPAPRPAPWPARLVVVAMLPVLVAAPPAYVVARVVLT